MKLLAHIAIAFLISYNFLGNVVNAEEKECININNLSFAKSSSGYTVNIFEFKQQDCNKLSIKFNGRTTNFNLNNDYIPTPDGKMSKITYINNGFRIESLYNNNYNSTLWKYVDIYIFSGSGSDKNMLLEITSTQENLTDPTYNDSQPVYTLKYYQFDPNAVHSGDEG